MTKKQLTALQNIIAEHQYEVNRRTEGENNSERAKATARNKKFVPKSPPVCGIKNTPHGYEVMCGKMGVLLHGDVPDLPVDETMDGSHSKYAVNGLTYTLIKEELDDGDYFLVKVPVSDETPISKFPSVLKENTISVNGGKNKVVMLTAYTESGSAVKGYFDPRYIRCAVDAVGGRPRLYIGQRRNASIRDIFYLIVDSGDSICSLEQNNMAIVMQIRKHSD